ncbi:O-antigen ligase family protein [Aquimarina sp. U1-2]|uniref:O-antigen ligase family protein n=1 Tax=Aquimarina sp. U1-2 TaxID=2823141 RepID=UPI001AEC863C|nr:O-antigen ligase family protein [Aquimarina sp. U1-2]MBP2833882.1 O-antigen ligase family protein [Aquimarina sp. U1-2]
MVYSFDEAINEISTTYWWNNFVHKAFLKSLEIHPSYLSLFSLSAINWNLNLLYKDLQNKTFDRTNIFYLIITTLFTILISSKMAYILLLLLVCIFLVRLVVAGLYKQVIFLGLSGFLLMISMYYALPSIRDRITVDFRNFKQCGFKLDNKSPASERIFIWKTSLDIIKKEPLGSFCQKTKKTIWQKISKSNKDLLEEKNAHNNFLEYGLMYGWFGISVLLAFICYTSFIVFKRKDIVFLGLLLIFLLFSLVESTLVREVGVIFMAFLFQFHFLTLNRAIKH